MSGMLGGGSTTTFDERLGSLRIQQSSQGVGIALVWGRQRITPNLLWFGDFTAIEHRESQGGKGGGGATQVTYTYKASMLLGLCAGVVGALPRRVWRDKDVLTSGTRVLPVENRRWEGVVPMGGVVVVPDSDRWSYTRVVYGGDTGEPTDNFSVSAGVYTFGSALWLTYCAIEYTIGGGSYSFNALEAAGFSALGSGGRAQSTWGYLSTAHADQAIGYSGIAWVAGVNVELSASAGVRQYSFEVDGRRMISDATPDANPADVCIDLLTDPLYGAVPNAAWVDGLSQFRSWCAAMGIFLSPAYSERKGAFEYVAQLAEIAFARPLWRVNTFTIVPLATEGIGGFTPLPEHSAPVYVITDDDISEPIEEDRKAPADRFNRVSVQYTDRATDYAEAVEPAEDKAAIDTFGLVAEPDVFRAPEIAKQAVAAIVAQLRLRKGLSVQGSYKFTLPVNFDLLDPLDIVSISDARINLDTRSVRIIEIRESGDNGALGITAEDVEITGAVTQASQTNGGYTYSTTVIDSSTMRAVLMPTAATGDVQQLWVGVTASVNWGGATLWISDTGSDYRRLGQFALRARMGNLTSSLAASGSELDTAHALRVVVDGGAAALQTVTQTDVDAARSLTWVGGELLAYRDVELTAPAAYALSYLRRGLYGTSVASHASGSSWMRMDEAILKVDVPADMLGRTVWLKATSRGLLGTTEQGLDEVTAVMLEVVEQMSLPAAVAALALTSPFVSTYFEVSWSAAARTFDYEVEVRSAGALLRSVQTAAQVFRYLYADAVDDGGALREYEVRVRGLNTTGGGAWTSVSISNPAPAAVVGIAESGAGASRTLTWDANTETDRAGYRAWISVLEDFDPKEGEGTQIYDGPATTAIATGLTAATTYYVRIAAYDVWSAITADLNLSDQFTFDT